MRRAAVLGGVMIVAVITAAARPVGAADCKMPPTVAAGLPGDERDTDGDGVGGATDRCRTLLPGAGAVDGEGCPSDIDRNAELVFDSSTHFGWYERFWTGSCAKIVDDAAERGTCQFAKLFHSEYWFETIEIVLAKADAGEHPVLRFDLWRLGRLIGHEWARNNDVRRIDSDDIRNWGDRLRAVDGSGVCAEIDTLFGLARQKLKRGR